ncbi:uncharacterized protein LOC132745999 [Ruditapes philippinarum]|uniref:uncharacterized protein LOC132745999 n=1 Tax=Ruditapes philippinarum TaxID=129788 RepID=UPI00295C3A0A|nr:uncharacterized protein LOC132745999 [Ruditapes philippinarum]
MVEEAVKSSLGLNWLLIFSGPYPSGQYILVVVDEHSRYPEVEIVHSTSAKVVIPRLQGIFARQGFPKVLKSDNGPPFQSQEFADFANACGFKHRRITPLWPEANGNVERFMGTLNKFVRVCVSGNRNWKSELNQFLMQYRATPHSSTKISPFEALTGRKMSFGLPDIPKSDQAPVSDSIVNNDAMSKTKMKAYADQRRHTSESSLKPGNHVLAKQPKLNKLTPPFDPDPYTVIEKKGSMVTAERDGRCLTRNSSFFRPIKNAVMLEDEEEYEAPQASSPESSIPAAPELVSSPESSLPSAPDITLVPVTPRRNPPRSTRSVLPQKMKDYVMSKPK